MGNTATDLDVAQVRAVTDMVISRTRSLSPSAVVEMVYDAYQHGQAYIDASRRITREANAHYFVKRNWSPYSDLYTLKVDTVQRLRASGRRLIPLDERLFDSITYGVSHALSGGGELLGSLISIKDYNLVTNPWITAITKSNAAVSQHVGAATKVDSIVLPGKDTRRSRGSLMVPTLGHLRATNAMRAKVLQLPAEDVEGLACAGIAWDIVHKNAFFHAYSLPTSLPDRERRALTAGFRISRVTVDSAMNRVRDELLESIGDAGYRSACGILMGVCVATQTRPYIGMDRFSKKDHDLLMEPWKLMIGDDDF
jgi:hypothetical protein